MDTFHFDKLKLKPGSIFDFMDQKGEVWMGSFVEKVGDDKFRFENFSNGQTQTIEIRNLQSARIIKQPGGLDNETKPA